MIQLTRAEKLVYAWRLIGVTALAALVIARFWHPFIPVAVVAFLLALACWYGAGFVFWPAVHRWVAGCPVVAERCAEEQRHAERAYPAAIAAEVEQAIVAEEQRQAERRRLAALRIRHAALRASGD